jgi:hypothetical protein
MPDVRLPASWPDSIGCQRCAPCAFRAALHRVGIARGEERSRRKALGLPGVRMSLGHRGRQPLSRVNQQCVRQRGSEPAARGRVVGARQHQCVDPSQRRENPGQVGLPPAPSSRTLRCRRSATHSGIERTDAGAWATSRFDDPAPAVGCQRGDPVCARGDQTACVHRWSPEWNSGAISQAGKNRAMRGRSDRCCCRCKSCPTARYRR